MLDQNIITLLSVTIGGFLAIAGGFIGSYITGRMAAKNEKIIYMRSKIEEAYMLIAKLNELNDNYYRYMIFEKDESPDQIMSQNMQHIEILQKLDAIANLYLHEIQKDFQKWMSGLRKTRDEANEKESNKEYKPEDSQKDLNAVYEMDRNLRAALILFCRKKGISKW